jgi:Ca2+-binding EF-hand superfamily protein
VSKASTYSIFKAFDVDGDGFVSHKDFERHLKQQKISATQEEISTLMKAILDTD